MSYRKVINVLGAFLMTRMYIQPSWIDAASDHAEWSGGNGHYRGDRSAEIATFDRNGRARVEAFSDDAIETRKNARKTSVPLKSRILPQAVRLEKLTAEIIELEESYRKGEFTPAEYTLLRSVAFKKRDRAQVLLNKAISTSHTSQNTDESEEFGVEYATQNSVREDTCGVSCGVAWVDELSTKNTFKKMLQNTCKASRTLVKWTQQAKAYYQELKEV